MSIIFKNILSKFAESLITQLLQVIKKKKKRGKKNVSAGVIIQHQISELNYEEIYGTLREELGTSTWRFILLTLYN